MTDAGATKRVAASYPLRFDVPTRDLHCPMLEVAIEGCATRLIVDTGATSHLLTTDVVERVGLDRALAPAGRDNARDAVASWSLGDVAMKLEDGTFVLRDVMSIDGPPPFRDWGVGGFLSPQSFAPDSTILLDLIAGNLEVIGGDVAGVAAGLVDRFKDYVVLEGVHHRAGTIGIEARMPDGPTVTAIFDTGAAESEIAADAVAGSIGGEKQVSGKGLGGRAINATPLQNQHLEFGEVRLRVPVLWVRDEIPAPEDAADEETPFALIGMDLLRGTALAIAPRVQGTVWWFVPEPG